MDDATARALNRINRRFYAERAADFSATREGPWPGWHELWRLIEARGLPGDARVLDVGCGNGRLGRFLAERRPALRYLGLDASEALLDRARAAGGLGTAPALRALDLVEDDLDAALGDVHFDLVACFGVLHHVPGRARRRRLLATLLGRLAPGGLLALTCWRLAMFERFRDKVAPWGVLPADLAAGLRAEALEPGDHLLPFGDARPEGGLRYVHFADEDETPALLEELPCQVVARFVADGREGNLNRYLVARSCAAPAPAETLTGGRRA